MVGLDFWEPSGLGGQAQDSWKYWFQHLAELQNHGETDGIYVLQQKSLSGKHTFRFGSEWLRER